MMDIELFLLALVLWGLMLACEVGRQRMTFWGQFVMSCLFYIPAMPLAAITFIAPGSVGAALMVYVVFGAWKIWRAKR